MRLKANNQWRTYRSSVHGWLRARLIDTAETERARYEASWYGPINSLLTHVFPLGQHFMVKPQAKLRTTYDSDDDDNDVGNVSIDSMGGRVLPRDFGGRENGVDEPDFMVVKAAPADGGDVPLAVIEVKRDDCRLSNAITQTQNYMKKIKSKDPPPGFIAVLVLAGHTTIFEVENGEPSPHDTSESVRTATELKGVLERVAARYWAPNVL